MADLEDVKAIDRFVRGLFANTAARRVALEAFGLEASVGTRAEELLARLAATPGGADLPRLSHGNALALVEAFDDIRSRDPKVVATLAQDDLPQLDPMFSTLALFR